MNNLINYQAFIEKKNILTINSLVLDIINYHQTNSQINVDLQVTGIVFTDNFDNKEQLNERLDFSFEVDKDINNLKLDNFTYQIVEGRGIEIEFDFVYDYNEERCLNDQDIKESIMEEVNQKLDDEFIYEEKQEDVVVEQDSSKSFDLPKTSRIVIKFQNDEQGNRIATRSR